MTARIIGVLFIIATVAYSFAVVLLDPIIGASDNRFEISLVSLRGLEPRAIP